MLGVKLSQELIIFFDSKLGYFFKSMRALSTTTNVKGKLRIMKPYRVSHVHFFREVAMKESCLHIKSQNIKILLCSNIEVGTNRAKFYH